MGEGTKIEWTDHTFNPWIGCTAVSPGCDHCYAEARMDTRLKVVEWGSHGERKRTSAKNWQMPLKWDRDAAKAGKRAKVFCASLADVFDNHLSILPAWRRDLWDLIAKTPHLDWLLLTKRPQNIDRYLPIHLGTAWFRSTYSEWPWPNVWLGTTVENQAEADRRIPHLLAVPAKVHFLSCEPLLGPVDLTRLNDKNGTHEYTCLECDVDPVDDGEWGGRTINWVICGGESGPGARPMNPQWARDLRDQCQAAGVPFHFKQNGEWVSVSEVEGPGEIFRFADGRNVRRIGKKRAGRTLDGREWNEVPT